MDLTLTIIFFAGVIVGAIFANIIAIKRKKAGKLVIVDTEDEPKPYLFIEINHEDLDGLMNDNVIEMNVERREEFSAKRKKNKLYYGNQ